MNLTASALTSDGLPNRQTTFGSGSTWRRETRTRETAVAVTIRRGSSERRVATGVHCTQTSGGEPQRISRAGALAVHPTAGWWKTRPALERYDQLARYALVVSIKAAEVDVDLYTAVENLIATAVKVET